MYLSKKLNKDDNCLFKKVLFSNVLKNSFIFIYYLLLDSVLKYSMVWKNAYFVYALPPKNTTGDSFFRVYLSLVGEDDYGFMPPKLALPKEVICILFLLSIFLLEL